MSVEESILLTTARKRMGGYGICMSLRLQGDRNGMQPAVAWAGIRRIHPRDTVVIEKVQWCSTAKRHTEGD